MLRTDFGQEAKSRLASRAVEKNIDAVAGVGAARLENISYAGHIGRLYDLLRRKLAHDPNPTISGETVKHACQLNGINKPTRGVVLNVLKSTGRIDVAKSGAVSVLGTTTTAVLETTADVSDDAGPSNDEEAVLEFSEKVAERPLGRQEETTSSSLRQHHIDPRIGLMIRTPPKSFSLSVTTTQSLAPATAAMIISSPLRG